MIKLTSIKALKTGVNFLVFFGCIPRIIARNYLLGAGTMVEPLYPIRTKTRLLGVWDDV